MIQKTKILFPVVLLFAHVLYGMQSNTITHVTSADDLAALVASGISLGSQDTKKTPLHEAACKGDAELVEALLQSDIDINAQDSNGWTALHGAVMCRQTKIVKQLLDHHAVLDFQDHDGRTPLHTAVMVNDLVSVKILLAQGARTNILDKKRNTALKIANVFGYQDIVTCLSEHEASRAVLHTVIAEGRTDMFNPLLKKGIDVNAQNSNGWTALHVAALRRKAEVIDPLINAGASVAIQDNDGRTPLHIACMVGHIESIEALLKHGASWYSKDMNGMTPLQGADLMGNANHLMQQLYSRRLCTNSMYYLFRMGADINAQDANGWTALHGAISLGRTDLANNLIAQGASLHLKDKDGRTPLHTAVALGSYESVKLLLDAGASANVQDKSTMTPLQRALLFGHDGIIKLMLDHGALLDVQNGHGWTAFHTSTCGANNVKSFLDTQALIYNSFFPPCWQPKSEMKDTLTAWIGFENLKKLSFSYCIKNIRALITETSLENIAEVIADLDLGAWGSSFIAYEAPLAAQRAIVSAWKQQDCIENKNKIATLIADHCQRHLICLQLALGLKNIHGQTALDIAQAKGNTVLIHLLHSIAETRRFSELDRYTRAAITYSITMRLNKEDGITNKN